LRRRSAWPGRLDLRLHGLARAAGANYTRYADDLAFWGPDDFAAMMGRFDTAVTGIVREEGFALNSAKTRVAVNEHCNTGRAEFDTLKAILHNCWSGEPEPCGGAGFSTLPGGPDCLGGAG
jgi:hypothetical protein